MTYELKHIPYPIPLSLGVLTTIGRITDIGDEIYWCGNKCSAKEFYEPILITFEREGKTITLSPDLDDFLNSKTIDENDFKLKYIPINETWIAYSKNYSGFIAPY